MRHFVFDTQAEARAAWESYNGRRGEVCFFWRTGEGAREGRHYYGDGRGPVNGLTRAWEAEARNARRYKRMMALDCKCGSLKHCPFYKCKHKFNKILDTKNFIYDAWTSFGLNAHHDYFVAIDGGERGGWRLITSSNNRVELEAWVNKLHGPASIFHRSEIVRPDAPVVKTVWYFDKGGEAHFVTDGDKIAPALAKLSELGLECGCAFFTYPQIAKINAGDFGLEAGAWISNAPRIVTFPQKEQK